MTQDDLARGVGLTRTSITNIESGKQPMRLHTALLVSGVLGVSVNDLCDVGYTLKPSYRADILEKVRYGE